MVFLCIIMINKKSKPAVRQIRTTDGKRWIAGRVSGKEFQVSRVTRYWKTKSPAMKFAKKMFE